MSAFATIAGLPVVDYRLTMPRSGVWVCEASMADARRPKGKVDLIIGTTTLKGTVELSVTEYETTVVRVRGGAGGMGTKAKPKHYSNAQLRLVLNDLLGTAGEKLSSTADSGILGTILTHWTVLGVPVGRQVAQLLAARGPDVAWRLLSDGTVWIGKEGWRAVAPEHELLQLNPLASTLTISAEDLVLPGSTFLGRKISYVEHSLLDGRIRSTITTE